MLNILCMCVYVVALVFVLCWLRYVHAHALTYIHICMSAYLSTHTNIFICLPVATLFAARTRNGNKIYEALRVFTRIFHLKYWQLIY